MTGSSDRSSDRLGTSDRLEEVRRELTDLDERHGINPQLPTAIVPEEVADQRRALVEERRRLEAEDS